MPNIIHPTNTPAHTPYPQPCSEKERTRSPQHIFLSVVTLDGLRRPILHHSLQFQSPDSMPVIGTHANRQQCATCTTSHNVQYSVLFGTLFDRFSSACIRVSAQCFPYCSFPIRVEAQQHLQPHNSAYESLWFVLSYYLHLPNNVIFFVISP